MRTPSRWILAVVTAVTLSGCVQIPDSSSVRPGRNGEVQGDLPPVFNLPAGPDPGADPVEIVEGFRAAMLASPRDASIAREFLAPDSAALWEPDARTLVYEGQRLLANDNVVTMSVQEVGSLSERGVWASGDLAEGQLTLTFDLEQVDGEWRINNPPPGTLVDADYFFTQRNYRSYSTYFLDANQRILVPDPIFLPVGDNTPTQLVQNLIFGPTRSLKGVVSSAVPVSTTVDGSVSVSGAGLADVPLSESVRNLSDADRQLLAAQLAWTLRQFPQIKRFTITSGGRPLEISGEGNTVDTDAFAAFDPAGFTASRDVFGLVDGVPSSITTSGASPLAADLPALTSTNSLAVDLRADTVAVVSGDGRSVKVADVGSPDPARVTTWCARGVDYGKPSWDTYGVLWVVDRRSDRSILSVCTADSVASVATPQFGRDRVTSFAVSRDGTRLAAVLGKGAASRLLVGAIERDPSDPAKATLRHVREIHNNQVQLTDLSAVSWLSPVSVAVLGKQVGDQVLVYDVRIDGSSVVPVASFLPVRPTTLAAAPNGDAPFVIGTPAGMLYIRSGDQDWLPFGSSARVSSPTLAG